MNFPISQIKRWNIKDSLFIKNSTGDGRKPTHLLMDGGKIHVSRQIEETFQRRYAADLMGGDVNYLLEVRTPITKLMVDLDVYEERALSYEEMRPWIQCIQSVVKDIYPDLTDHQRRVIICTTDTTSGVFKGGEEYTKQGLGHLIWPGIHIDTANGMLFRGSVIQKLEEQFGKRHKNNIWADVIDDTIYKQNGLRMVGSAKIGYCSDCKNKKKKSDCCELCFGTGKYYIGRIYIVQEVMSGNGECDVEQTKLLQDNYLERVKQTSIRTYENTGTPQVKPEWYDDWHIDEKSIAQNKMKRFYGKDKVQLTNEDRKGFGEHDLKERLSPESKEYRLIKRSIHKIMPKVYRRVEIMDIHLCNQGNNNYYLVRTHSSFCMNVARDHNSNTIFFVVNEHGMFQKCFCRCDTLEGRRFGLCRDYRSKVYELPMRVKRELFPNVLINAFQKRGVSIDVKQPQDDETELRKIIEMKLNEIQMWQDLLDGKADFEKRFDNVDDDAIIGKPQQPQRVENL